MKDVFKKLLEVRDVAHQLHLMARSGTLAQHIELEEFYTSIVDQFDEFVEVYQGQYEIVDDYGVFEPVDYKDPIKYFTEFVEFLKKKRKEEVNEDNKHFDTMFDNCIITTYKLIYKLKFLK